MKHLLFSIIILFFSVSSLIGQSKLKVIGSGVSVSDNGLTTPDATAVLDIKSNQKGMLFPRLSTAQRDQIQNPAEGLIIYNLDRHLMEFYNGSKWAGIPFFIFPETPGNLTAVAASYAVQLTWEDNNTDEEGYEVQRSITGNGAGFETLAVVDPDAVAYSDEGLAVGTYYYRVRALGTEGNVSEWSSEAFDEVPIPGHKNSSFDFGSGFNNTIFAIAIQPDGKTLVGGTFTTYKGITENRIIRLNPDGTKDASFDNGSGGFSGGVNTIAIQSDGKILVGGNFTSYKGESDNNRIIRLNSDGSKDISFVNSGGFGSTVTDIKLQEDGKILVGGTFTTYKSATENKIIRLTSDGSKDETFNNGNGGFVGSVFCIRIQTDGKVLVGGSFGSYQGDPNNGIIRLNSDGSKDISFDNGNGGITGIVNCITIQPDQKIFLGGNFTEYKGQANNSIIRLNVDGSKDSSFDNVIGFGGLGVAVNIIACQSDGKLITGGSFTSYKSESNNRIIRLNTDGSQDITYDNAGGGFDNIVRAIAIQNDGTSLVAGSFTTYKGESNSRIIRLNN